MAEEEGGAEEEGEEVQSGGGAAGGGEGWGREGGAVRKAMDKTAAGLLLGIYSFDNQCLLFADDIYTAK